VADQFWDHAPRLQSRVDAPQNRRGIAENRTITIAPVRKSTRVKASQAHAFEVFTSGLVGGGAHPPIGSAPVKFAVMETRLGGRWYQLCEDGRKPP
jgi:hypothetical protein